MLAPVGLTAARARSAVRLAGTAALLAAGLLAAGRAAAQAPPAQTPVRPASVLVSGANLPVPVPLSAAQLAALPRQQLTRAGHDGQPHAYSGVALWAVLAAAGVKTGPELPGKGMAHYLLVSAADGYRAVLALAELDPAFAPQPVLLADRCDGQPLPAAAGPYQLIVPQDKKMGRCVRQVQALRLLAAPPQP